MRRFLLLLLLPIITEKAAAQSSDNSMRSLIKDNLQFAASQYQLLFRNTPDTMMPRFFDPAKNKMESSDTKWWCSGFFPGTLLYIYEYTRDTAILRLAEKKLSILEKEKHFTGNHDLGFMMFCSFGNAYRLTGNPAYKEAVMTAAGSLATRYRPAIQSIQSWNGGGRLHCPVIIDNMMNLELLYWVSDQGGDPKYREIALTHSNSTMERHFRPDNSSYHVLDYDLTTGKIIQKITWQGAADSSAWARGQAWGLYGFTMMYRFSKNKAYLEQARKIAQYLLNHPNLPADKIPYWDFHAPGIPGTYRDASAAAIIASALLELAQYVKKAERKQLLAAAETMLRSLASPAYRSAPGENAGFLIKHNVGSLPHKSEVDVSLTYADYYFIEALLRYQKWYSGK